MLSKAQVKYIRSLALQKYRKEHNAYIAEGDKLCREWLSSSAALQYVVCLEAWAQQNQALIGRHPEAELLVAAPHELEAISQQQTPNQALIVAKLPHVPAVLPREEWCLALDTIQDPGNLGTIIRIADWFGIGHVVCSPDCADAFSPKVVQAAMGGHLRVQLHQADLLSFLDTVRMPVLAAALEGEDVYRVPRQEAAVLLIGNESKGLHPELLQRATGKVTIPRAGGAESLNAAVSAGILCALLLPRKEAGVPAD